MNRRKFLRIFGISAVSAPVIAKTVGEIEPEPQLANINPYDIIIPDIDWNYDIGMVLKHNGTDTLYCITGKFKEFGKQAYLLMALSTGIEFTTSWHKDDGNAYLKNHFIVIGHGIEHKGRFFATL